MDKRKYIHPKEMDFIVYVLRSKDEFDKGTVEFYESKILQRFETLSPLIEELKIKGIDLRLISVSLYEEYRDVIFLMNKINETSNKFYSEDEIRNINRLLNRFRKK